MSLLSINQPYRKATINNKYNYQDNHQSHSSRPNAVFFKARWVTHCCFHFPLSLWFVSLPPANFFTPFWLNWVMRKWSISLALCTEAIVILTEHNRFCYYINKYRTGQSTTNGSNTVRKHLTRVFLCAVLDLSGTPWPLLIPEYSGIKRRGTPFPGLRNPGISHYRYKYPLPFYEPNGKRWLFATLSLW